MTTCIFLAGMLHITCTLAPGPKLTPAQAAEIIGSHPYARPQAWPVGGVVGSSPSAGPFGEFALRIPERRLDGTLWTEPQLLYGLPPWGGVPTAYSLPTRYGSSIGRSTRSSASGTRRRGR